MAGNWQNKGNARVNVGFKVHWKQMLWYIPSTLELKLLAAHNFEYVCQKKDIFVIWSTEEWLLGYLFFANGSQWPKLLNLSQKENGYSDAGKISGTRRKYSTNVSALLIKMQSEAGRRSLNSLHSRYHLKPFIKSFTLSENMNCVFVFYTTKEYKTVIQSAMTDSSGEMPWAVCIKITDIKLLIYGYLFLALKGYDTVIVDICGV